MHNLNIFQSIRTPLLGRGEGGEATIKNKMLSTKSTSLHQFSIVLAIFFFSSFFALAENPMQVKQYNLSSFSKTEKIISEELKNLTPKAQQQHPEFGILPYNAQCNDCVELLQKRTEHERYFVKNGSKGKHFYAQKSLQPLHYKNEKQ
jgi:hypothetical protein